MKSIKEWINTERKRSIALSILVFSSIFFSYIFLVADGDVSYGSITYAEPENVTRIYLSDLDYITENNWSFNGWAGHAIQKDRNPEGGTINLIVDGERRPFVKGLGLHARGQVVYDISEFSADYPRFIAKLGVDSSRGTNGSIWFQIFGSNDGQNWTSLLKTNTLTGTSEAVKVDLDIEGYKYLKLYVDPAGNNDSDHGSIADAKLVTKDYVVNEVPYERIHRVEYYDEILRTKDLEYNYNNNYAVVLEREFVNKLDFWNIQCASDMVPYFYETMEWLLNNTRVLEEIIEVGEISNGSLFLNVLSELHHKYKDSLEIKNGYVYEKMMIGLAAAYSTDRVISPLSFSFVSSTTYDYMERFELMKRLFDNGQFRRVKVNALQGEFISNDWFKDYHVQLMRMVMQDGTSNVDLVWLNGYTNEKQSVSFYMIPYISPNYNQARFYDEANRELYDNKYFLSKYNVPYGVRVARYWMVIEGGGICWNASRFGQSMYRVNGIPATGAYQPGHELYIQYYQDDNGNGYWTPRYGNWGSAGSTWGGGNPYRYIFNWGNKYFADKHISGSKGASSTGYLYLGQANLNRLDQYKKSLYYNLIANSYTDNDKKLDSYFKALEVNDLNLDSYDYIISLYKKMSVQNEGGTITAHNWYELANKIIEAYRYHPVAMFDLLKVIRPYLEGSEKLYIDRLEKETLINASRVTGNDTIQVDAVRTHANQLLNKSQPDPMTFSFDGENAGKIVKNPIYSLAWGYSLDGGKSFTDFKMDDSIALTPEELAQITPENDIIINFMGLKDYTFRIDITKGVLSNLLFANDLENRVVGIDLTYEWRNSESDPWTSYRKASPDNTGDKTLYVRRGNTGTQLASDSASYTFTADNQPNTRKYVPVSHLSIHSVSTQATNNAGAATYAIDGNYNTRYHSAWDGTDTQRFVVIKLDKPRYVSAVEFVPAGGGNGKIYDGSIWGSTDGENWEVLTQRTGITYSNAADNIEQAKENTKSFDITNPKEVQYIKIVADRTNGNWFTAREFNIFQDITNNERPTAGVGYSTTDPTTSNVIARLVNVSVANYEILSAGGDTHEFTSNGEFTFRFRDTDTGLEGSALAKVDWIDRTAPTATVEYSTRNPINSSVFATLKPSENIKVINNGYYSIDEDGKVYDEDGNHLIDYTVDENGVVRDSGGKIIDPLKYEFIDNGEFTFEFIDRAGNRGTATAKVDWIDMSSPIATLSYSKNTLTNQNVTVTVDFNESANVTNNDRNKTYTFEENGEFTFEFSDKAGNKGEITAKVTWIDKVAPTAELKYEILDDKVIVTVINSSEEINFAEGIGVYEFTQNGNYEIVFYDRAGNEGKLVASITSFEENENKPGGNPDENESPNKPNEGNKPSVPVNPSKPGIPGNNEGNQKPSDSGKPNNKPVNIDYKKFTVKSIVVEVPSGAIIEDADLFVDEFELASELEGKFGNASEYYDIYLLKGDERIDIKTTSPTKITIKLKGLKEFIGVYEISDGNVIKPVNFVKNGGNVEITTKSLGRYVVSYKELKIVSPEETLPVTSKNKTKKMVWMIASIASIAGLIIFFYRDHTKK